MAEVISFLDGVFGVAIRITGIVCIISLPVLLGFLIFGLVKTSKD